MQYMTFAIFDSKAHAFFPPFYQQSKGLAMRMFSDTANDARTMVNRHPEDYTLFYLGTWEDNDGQHSPEITPEPLAKALELLNDQPLPLEKGSFDA